MNVFLLTKLVGLITMFIDHYGDVLVGHTSMYNYWGRIAFPLFATINNSEFFLFLCFNNRLQFVQYFFGYSITIKY